MSKNKDKQQELDQEQFESAETQTVDASDEKSKASSKKEDHSEEDVQEKLQSELKQEKDKFLRLFAEFENYKRRTAKERIELFSTASEDVMKTLLPVVDDFERALTHLKGAEGADELEKGVDLIYQKLLKTLEQKGLKAIEVASGDVFDADKHEAVTQIPAPSDDMKGKIIDVIEKGYKLGDKIIRFPKVVIGQ
ncbi:nucleotide exchange factor GrpE [Gaetbulibacter aestuarii]|uniref:Protein GrpE n=1 Tax=Gaetbulibacter aestuarii TaxID=1502358 RepID=A0ABW7MXR0_9FLAO